MSRKLLLFITVSLLLPFALHAKHRVFHLSVGYKTVNFAESNKQAIAVNGQIPAPTLAFDEGDVVTFYVKNTLNKETAIHWHGLLVPWQMDGVLGLTQHGIQPGQTFKYQFRILQSGTYWYHAHAGLQEQSGLYGALVIHPKKPDPFHFNKEYPIVLSDWTNLKPMQAYRNLKKDGEYFSPNFPLQASLLRFITDYSQADEKERMALKMDYMMMQKMRMGIYDFTDVAYDAFLLNGRTKQFPWIRQVRKGDVVRLRFIDSGANTFFNVKMPGAKFNIVQMDGNNVKPHWQSQFSIGPGETVDALVTIKKNQPYTIYAESSDTLGSAIGVLTPYPLKTLPTIKPFPIPKPTTREMHHNKHRVMMHPEKTIGTKYQNLVANTPTNNPNKPIYNTINMDLGGYMDSYIWFINGVPGYDAKPIILEPAKRYRIVFHNKTMMHHPMHIHGHWFILRNGHGKYDPLLHTIDVPPGAKVYADIDTDASGQWFFHCHMLMHMLGGMNRVFQYSSLLQLAENKIKPLSIEKNTELTNRPIVRVDKLRPIPINMVKKPHTHGREFFTSNLIEFGNDFGRNTQSLTYVGLFGPDFNKFQLFINDAEWSKGKTETFDVDFFYWHQLSRTFAVKGGINYFNQPASHPYWQPGIGFESLFQYFIETNARAYWRKRSLKLDIDITRETQLTNNLFLATGIRSIWATNTVADDLIAPGLNQVQYTIGSHYRLKPGLSVFLEYERDQYYAQTKRLVLASGERAGEDLLSVGLAALL